MFGTNHPKAVVVFMLAIFAGLCVASFKRPPYHARAPWEAEDAAPAGGCRRARGNVPNRMRTFLDFGLVWVHLNMLLYLATAWGGNYRSSHSIQTKTKTKNKNK